MQLASSVAVVAAKPLTRMIEATFNISLDQSITYVTKTITLEPCDQQPKAQSNPSIHNAFTVSYRMDGRVELICRHGVGHPSKALQKRRWKKSDGVHGCDRCCQSPEFAEAEKHFKETL